jgi:glycosyltransferase involved in cell wall biosynthesis
MNILHVIQRYWPYIGGSEGYFQEISERLVRDGNAVQVYTTDAWDIEHFWSPGKRTIDAAEETHNGVRIRRFPVQHPPLSPLVFPVLRRILATLSALSIDTTPLLLSLCRLTPWVPALERALDDCGDPVDLVHATNIPFDSLIYAAFRFAHRRNIPSVITPFTHLGEPDKTPVRKYYTMRHQIYMMRHSAAVIVQTELERKYLASCGVPREKMHCVGVGVNPDQVQGGEGARFRTKYGIDGPIVVSLGTTAYDKGTHHTVAAMRQLWERGVEATLVLAGPTMKHFVDYLRTQPKAVQQRCRLLGFIPDADKRDLLDAADVLALPSRTDSFGIVFLEAWLYRKSVVGAWAGGVPEVVHDGEDGYLVRFGDVEALADRIEALLRDQATARKFGERGYATVLAEHTWDKKYAQIKEIYERVTESTSR